MSICNDPSIPEFFAGKNVFVTGGHGFIGKALTEKLLRSCRDVGNIYWLIREKKGMQPEERARKALDNVLFDKLRKENPDALNKVKVMRGDVQKHNLDLSEENLKILVEQVQIVVHSAATVRFDEPLKAVINLNVKGTREVSQVVLQMKEIKAFCYVSTLYCQHDKGVIEEKFYPGNGDWRQAIEVAENFDENQLNILCPKFVGGHPNTYVFSKGLAEHCVRDLCGGKVPLIIFRPGIVIPIHESPLSGWADGITGPSALVYGIIQGVLRSVLIDLDAVSANIPVDYIVKGMISSVYKKGLERFPLEDVPYYNGSYNSVSYSKVLPLLDEIISNIREKINIYPFVVPTKNYKVYLAFFYILQLLPAFLMDLGHKIVFFRPPKFSMVKLQRKIYQNINIYSYFMLNGWDISNGNFMGLLTGVREDDFEEFGVLDRVHPSCGVWYTVHSFHFIQENIFRRKLEKEPIGLRKIKILKFCTYSLLTILCIVLGYFCVTLFRTSEN